MRASQHAPRNPCCVLESQYSLAEIVERGAVILAEYPTVNHPHSKREIMILAENASRHGHHFAQQCFGFFKLINLFSVRRAVNACPARLTRVVVGGYDVTQWYAPQPSPTSSTSSASTVGPGHFRSVSEPFPPGWLDEPPTPPTPAAALHPLTQL